MNVYEKLAAIQQEIKVTKDQNNDFAGFKYRSAEDILEKLKPLLAAHKVTVTLSDSLEEVAGSVYVKADAIMIDYEESNLDIFAHTSAYAREEKTRPKMSEGQLTGAASSYARKYALNGLLLLDDNKDPDSQDNSRPKPQKAAQPAKPRAGLATQEQREAIKVGLEDMGITVANQKGYLIEQYGVGVPLTEKAAAFVLDELGRT